MNTLTNAYERKLSSGLVVSLLVLSAISFVPLIISPVHATNSQFTASIYYPYTTTGQTGVIRTLKISNPLGNLGITEVDLNMPTASAAAVSAGAFVAGFVNGGTVSVAGTGPWTIVYPASSSTASILPAGAAGKIDFTFNSEAAETTTHVADSYALTLTVHYSDGSTQTTAVTLYEGSLSTTSVATTVTTATAGTAFTYTLTLGSKDSGIPLAFLSDPTVANVAADGFTESFGTPKLTTTSSLTYTSTFTTQEASATALGDSVTCTDGSCYYFATVDVAAAHGSADSGGFITGSFPGTHVNVLAAAPTEVTIATGLDSPGHSPTYISAGTTTVTLSLADSFGNAVTGETGTAKLTVLAGHLDHRYLTITAGTPNMTQNYLPYATGASTPLAYGTFDLISASLSVTAPSAIAGTYSGSSKQLSIGCVAGNCATPPTPTITYYAASGTPVAGSTIGLSITLTGPVQKSVPVNFTLTTTDPTVPYTGTFANGKSWIVVSTSSSGVAAANFTADTTLGDAATAMAIVSVPISSTPSQTYSSAATSAITTVAGSAAQLKVSTYSDSGLTTASKYVAPSGHLYAKVTLADAYGNTVGNNLAFAIQINLATSAGGLSSTIVYINVGQSSTSGSGYTIQFTAPTAVGSVTITASTPQSGISSATKTLQVVSANPTVSLTPPVTTTLSSNTVTVNATGLPSLAASAGTVVTTFKYSLNGAANLTAGVTSTNSSGAAFTSFTVSMLNGTNTVKIFATDSNGYVGVGTFTFIVTHAPISPTTFTTTGATSAVSNGFTGVSVTFTNTGGASTDNVYFVWYNAANQIVSVGAQLNVPFTAGGSATFFNSYSAPGTYTVQVFVQSTSGNALSTSYSATVTIS